MYVLTCSWILVVTILNVMLKHLFLSYALTHIRYTQNFLILLLAIDFNNKHWTLPQVLNNCDIRIVINISYSVFDKMEVFISLPTSEKSFEGNSFATFLILQNKKNLTFYNKVSFINKIFRMIVMPACERVTS